MPKFTDQFIQAKSAYHTKYSPARIEVDWSEYTKNPQDPDQTKRVAYIYTEHTTLKSIDQQDTDFAYQYFWGDPDVMKLFGTGVPQQEAQVETKIGMWEDKWKKQKDPFSGFTIFTTIDDTFLGNIVLAEAKEKMNAELAYCCPLSYKHHIYEKEYTGAVVFDWGQYIIESFDNFTLPNGHEFKNIIASSRTDNTSSNKILKDTLQFSFDYTEEQYDAFRHCYIMPVMGDDNLEEGLIEGI